MPEPFTMGAAGAAAFGWAARRFADRALDRLIDRALDGPGTWQTPWGAGTNTIDITVGNSLRIQARTPVILTLQEAGDPDGGTMISFLLGDTTRVSLPRGNFVSSAMIVDPHRDTGIPPVLRGLGWSQVQVGQGSSRLVIPTRRPTARLLSDVGLEKPDGTPLFRVPQARRALPAADTDVVTSSGIALPAPLRPKPLPRVLQNHDTYCCARDRYGMRCLAQLSASSTRLCARHGLLVKLGIAVYDYSTGRQIYAD